MSGKIIFICGMPGSGKTTLGRKLAEELQLPFSDLDELIEETENTSVTSLFAEQGEEAFRKAERAALRTFADQQAQTPQILSVGGGTPCFYDNMDFMKKHGLTIYLDTDLNTICDRLSVGKQMNNRPLVKEMNDLYGGLQKKLKKRRSFYEKADVKIKGDTSLKDISLEISCYLATN